MRGPIFESWVVAEILKSHLAVGEKPKLSFFRDAHGLEIDVMVERGTAVTGVEVKSGATVPLEAFAPLEVVAGMVPEMRTRIVVYGGAESFKTKAGRAVPYGDIDSVDWTKS